LFLSTMVFGLRKRGSQEEVGSGLFSLRKGRSVISYASTTDAGDVSRFTSQGLWSARSVEDHSVVKPEEAQQEETQQHESKTETHDFLGSSLDRDALGEAFHSELNDKKTEGINAVDSAEGACTSINSAINAGQHAFEDEKARLAAQIRREEEASKSLAEHGSCLDRLRKDLEAQASASLDKVVKDNATAQKLETELAAAESALKAARAKADEARSKRIENVATNTAAVAAADDNVVAMKVQMAATTERHRTTEASLALTRARMVELREKVASCEREKDFALEAMESLSRDHNAAILAKQSALDLHASSVATLKAHIDDSERRVLGHEAELRRCQNRAQAAKKLRDLASRSALHDGDRQSFDIARGNAQTAADQAAVAVDRERQAMKTTQDADQARTLELTSASEKAALSLNQREIALEAVAARFATRKNAAFNVRALHTAAVAEHDVVTQEVELLEKRVADLAEAHAACALKVEDAIRQAADAVRKAAAEEMPLNHAEQAEAIVVQNRETDMTNVRRALEAARLGAKEAEADAAQLMVTRVDAPAVLADHALKTADLIQAEMANVSQCQQCRSSTLAQLQVDAVNASAQWDAKREALNGDLHRAEMALRLAREDLSHHDGVREMFKECREGGQFAPSSLSALVLTSQPSSRTVQLQGA
jgi:hypothetical protein